jgi:lipoyl(octanoyl) transferase
VNNDLEAFKLIIPCGIGDRPVTSLKKELDREILQAEVMAAVARGFANVFRREIGWQTDLEELTGHPPQDLPMKPPRELRHARGEEELFLA